MMRFLPSEYNKFSLVQIENQFLTHWEEGSFSVGQVTFTDDSRGFVLSPPTDYWDEHSRLTGVIYDVLTELNSNRNE